MTSSTINGSVESLNSAVAFMRERARPTERLPAKEEKRDTQVKQRRTTDLNVPHDKKQKKNLHLHPEYARSTYCIIQYVKLDTLKVSVWLHRAHGGMHHAHTTYRYRIHVNAYRDDTI